ncbi:interleukin-12 receptor subunit beta-2 [Morone saxatilis]|uniref:interleukin-12 receptor subunit beta-2 n=1 Tax=Morone saxatilis TaxID=34816 RepID=UPI0015E23465|nr:interleukin-12 receptor subunit beta-2 [Morone saxatilis]
MATMSQTWFIFIAVTVLAVQLCIGEKSCVIWSSAGPVVTLGSSFEVYCTFNCKCKGSMSCYPPIQQECFEFNSTTMYFKVGNITTNRTYSCQCDCTALDPCGLDIYAGYKPESPKNISCTYEVINNERGAVFCNWIRGRDTYLWNSSVLWVRTRSGTHTDEPVSYKVSSKGTDPSASFTVSSSVQLISVWVQVQNPLGNAMSMTFNYTLSDIAMPSTPVLVQPECSSRECVIKVQQSVRTQRLEIQYRAEAQTWTSYLDSGVQTSLEQVISSLEPYRLYHFRARSKFSTGLWSQWSTNVSSRTQEEGRSEPHHIKDGVSTISEQEANISITRGKIVEYRVRVWSQTSGVVFSTNISANARNYSVPFCAKCEVTLWACNSKGMSPPARITTHHRYAKPVKVVQVTADNHTVTISWRKPETAPPHVAYVVEWYPEGHKLEELRWVRLGRNDNRAVITGIKPFECYEGAVYVVYNESSVSKRRFTGVATSESAPAAGSSVKEEVEGNKVKVTWIEIPRDQRGGCITIYTIYLESDSGYRQSYSMPASERTHIIKDLPPAVYSLWMTASTATGEGPAGQKIKFFILQETQLSLLLMCGLTSLIVLFLLCLCQSSAVRQRFWMFFPCLKLDDVPDPANSKWAKECTQEKGKMNLQLQSSNSSAAEEEEEPILVDVEELPKQSTDIHSASDVSSLLPHQTSMSPMTEPVIYIKSFSHDSDSSDHTHTSLDTNTTVDYISGHGPENIYEDEEVEDDGEPFLDMLGFFPSHNIIIEPFGGKLTLDAVKIDCNDFFQNS